MASSLEFILFSFNENLGGRYRQNMGKNFSLSRKLAKFAKEKKAAKTLGIVMGEYHFTNTINKRRPQKIYLFFHSFRRCIYCVLASVLCRQPTIRILYTMY